MALLTCLQALTGAEGFTLMAAHYNHQLRGEESRQDEAFVRAWCSKTGVPLFVGRGDVASRAAETGQGLEETARAMRYAFLEETARTQGAVLATAHNADDNAETLLLHLIRGTGLDGLAGIPPVRGNIIRPLLSHTRQEIEAFLAAEGVPYRTDSSNADPTYARNRIRRDVMPVLRDMNPGFSHRLSANLDYIRADRAYLESLARETVDIRTEDGGLSLSAEQLNSLPRPLAVRGIRQTLANLGLHQISAVHLEDILDLAARGGPSAQLSLPRGLTVRRVYDRLVFSRDASSDATLSPTVIPGPGTYDLGPWQMDVAEAPADLGAPQGPYHWNLLVGAADFPLTVRRRRTGDRLRLPGRVEKSLKKWYIDEKIPLSLRDTLPVLTDSRGTILAAAGLGPASERTAPSGVPALSLTLRKTERT